MDPRLLRAFQERVWIQCEWVLLAWTETQAGLAHFNNHRVFYGIQNLLTAAANISKAFWGQQGKLAKEREPLRSNLGVRDDSPLRPTAMRNNYDHFDERLDKWWRESKLHNHSDLNVGPAHFISVFEPIDMFRNLDPETKTTLFWGDEFNLQAIVNEVNRLLPKLRAEAGKPRATP